MSSDQPYSDAVPSVYQQIDAAVCRVAKTHFEDAALIEAHMTKLEKQNESLRDFARRAVVLLKDAKSVCVETEYTSIARKIDTLLADQEPRNLPESDKL